LKTDSESGPSGPLGILKIPAKFTAEFTAKAAKESGQLTRERVGIAAPNSLDCNS